MFGEVQAGGPASDSAAAVPGPVLPSAGTAEMQVSNAPPLIQLMAVSRELLVVFVGPGAAHQTPMECCLGSRVQRHPSHR